MLLVHAVGAGYRHYTAEFLQAASLRPGNPITVAGIPVGTVTSMKLDGDHVEAGPEDSRRCRAGQGFESGDQGRHHPGWALPRRRARRPGSLAAQHVRFDPHRSSLRPSGRVEGRHHHFRTAGLRPIRPIADRAWQANDGPARGGAPGAGEHRRAVVDHRAAARPVGPAAQKHRAGDQHIAQPASQHRQPGQPRPRPDGCIRRAACGFPRDDAVPDRVLWTF